MSGVLNGCSTHAQAGSPPASLQPMACTLGNARLWAGVATGQVAAAAGRAGPHHRAHMRRTPRRCPRHHSTPQSSAACGRCSTLRGAGGWAVPQKVWWAPGEQTRVWTAGAMRTKTPVLSPLIAFPATPHHPPPTLALLFARELVDLWDILSPFDSLGVGER
jgi:hypothetical protein